MTTYKKKRIKAESIETVCEYIDAQIKSCDIEIEYANERIDDILKEDPKTNIEYYQDGIEDQLTRKACFKEILEQLCK